MYASVHVLVCVDVQVDVKDIEQLVSMSQKLGACPYYAARLAVPSAQVSVKYIQVY